MTTVSAPPRRSKTSFDPDEFRMTIGEHLEELRKRLILGLGGFAVALVFFMIPSIGNRVMVMFIAPLTRKMLENRLTPQIHVIGVTEGFMTYLQVSVVCALVVAAPWLLFQMWLFIAAGLYQAERKTITRYIPLSVALLTAGVLFVYFIVLPLTIDFFIKFNGSIPMPDSGPSQVVPNPKLPVQFPILEGDPASPQDGWMWYNALESRLKIKVHGEIRVLQFTAQNLIASTFTLDDYISFVFTFMLVFGLAFQLPLVMLALVRVGIVEISFLRKQRRLVYFIMAIVAAVIAPGDIVTSMLALLIPMMFLYEFGIWLAIWGQRKRDREEARAS